MIEIKNFSFSYSEGKKACDNVNLTVNDGEIFGFIGHNGAGKSTTIKAMVGILDFSDGDILLNGSSIRKSPIECKEQFAYIPDNPDLYENLSGTKYLNFIADIYKLSKKDREERIHEYASRFEIEQNLAEPINSYSHGMKQKIAIIGALIHEPKILILDEPFVGLDPIASHSIKEIMREMCSRGCTIFFSSHVLEVVEKLCDHIAIIKNGQIVKNGTVDEVRGDTSLENMFLELSENA